MLESVPYAFAVLTVAALLFAGFGWARVLKLQSMGRIAQAAVPTVAAFLLAAVTLALALL